MNKRIQTIAFYLPQFHQIKENDEWWGEGFTEWTNMKKATSLYDGHYQPRIPLNGNYYDLTDSTTIKWQATLAKTYGVDGFCMYHYWFNGKMLLEKPMEILLRNPDIDMNYCICWANESWTNAWVSSQNKVLIEQTYGDSKEWIQHFEYFLKFFKDQRYILDNNRPILIIYRPELIPKLNEMLDFWNKLAIHNGFDGICYGYQQSGLDDMHKDNSMFSFDIEYQPKYALKDKDEKNIFRKRIRNIIDRLNQTLFSNHVLQRNSTQVRKYDYDEIWEYVLERQATSEKSVAGAFVDWDNTPRRGKNGIVFENASPEKFEYYMRKQYKNVLNNYKLQYLFIFAWNEWAEGGYLEPDQKYQNKYLQSLRKAQDVLK